MTNLTERAQELREHFEKRCEYVSKGNNVGEFFHAQALRDLADLVCELAEKFEAQEKRQAFVEQNRWMGFK